MWQSPDKPILGRRFIWCWRNLQLRRWRHYSDALHRCIVGSSGAEDLASTRLTCSLVNPPVITSTIQTWHRRIIRCHLVVFHQCCKLYRCLCVGLSDAYRILWCPCIGSSGATGFCRTHLFQFFFELFFRVLFYLDFCFISGIYKCLLNKFISPIDCVVTQSPKSQNNSLMGLFSLQGLNKWVITWC